MDKREEIKKHISFYLRKQFVCDQGPDDECDIEADYILTYLDSQGVVILWKEELPTGDWNINAERLIDELQVDQQQKQE